MKHSALKKYGWKPDMRDFLYCSIKPKIKLPGSVDLRSWCSDVEDQGKLGSCTANALAGNLEFLDNRVDGEYTDVSRLFIYYNERAMEGNIPSDSGAALRDGIKTLAALGVCPEEAWPYDIAKFARKPPVKCYQQALKRKIVSYHRMAGLNEMLTCLADGYPFVFGFAVYESFESAKVASTGIVPMPRAAERVLGGHAVMAVGYDLNKKFFIVRNSWSPRWGMHGYCCMPFAYLEGLARDFWTVRK